MLILRPEPTTELLPELAVEPPPLGINVLALIIPVIICGGKLSLLIKFSRISRSYRLQTSSLVFAYPIPARKYCW